MTEGTTAGTQEVARQRRARFALADMVRSLGLLVVVIAVLLFIGPARSLILPSSSDRYPAVDYSGYVRGFVDDAHTEAVLPSGLPSSWRANGGSLHQTPDAVTLHIGWAVPGELFAGLDEGVGNPSVVFIGAISRPSVTTSSTTTIAGRQWAVGRSPRGEQVLVAHINGVLVVLTGDATDAQLRTLASSLR